MIHTQNEQSEKASERKKKANWIFNKKRKRKLARELKIHGKKIYKIKPAATGNNSNSYRNTATAEAPNETHGGFIRVAGFLPFVFVYQPACIDIQSHENFDWTFLGSHIITKHWNVF